MGMVTKVTAVSVLSKVFRVIHVFNWQQGKANMKKQ